MPLDAHAARFLSMLAAGGDQTRGAPIGERRAALEGLARLADRVDRTVATREHRLSTAGGDLALRAFEPPGAAPRGPGVLYLHGGGWTTGSLDTHAGVCAALAKASGFRVLSVDYRLAPEHPFPAGLQDAEAALLAVQGDPDRFGVDAQRLILAGDSAGATLAAALAGRVQNRTDCPALARLALICPILDPPTEAASRVAFADGYFIDSTVLLSDLRAYLGADVSAEDERVSPLRRLDLSGWPPTHIHLAEFDPFRDEGLAYAERLKAAGVFTAVTVHPGMIHYFYALSRAIPHANIALQMIGAELKAAMA